MKQQGVMVNIDNSRQNEDWVKALRPDVDSDGKDVGTVLDTESQTERTKERKAEKK